MRVETYFRENSKKIKVFYNATKLVLAVIFLLFFVLFGINWAQKKFFYPLEYTEYVNASAEKYGLDPAVIYAVIKIESGFKRDVESKKGAKGLMQITDGTAEYIAKLLGVKEYNLLDEKTNIEFGSFYLRYLLNKFTALETAIVAYNAGEGVVSYWLSQKQYSDDQITLKAIPYKETRDYIKKFNKSFAKYHKLYGNILDKPKNFE
ncbi:MAG: lytic transglycosylase domain-containing protein [Clostridia bacterium]|nr:lytic transglycosylase domain-containing protein [Clostridia bacterium]